MIEELIETALKDLDLYKYYPGMITTEAAKELKSKRLEDKTDIPKFFLMTVLNHEYNGRCTFLLGQYSLSSGEDSGTDDEWGLDIGENEQVYGFLDVTVLVLLCCEYSCKQNLACKMQQNGLSAPLMVPCASDNTQCILQTSILRGIMHDVGYDSQIPIVSFVAANGIALNKTRIANILISQEDCHKPFYDFGLEQKSMGGGTGTTIFEVGLIDAFVSRPTPCSCQDLSNQNAIQACTCTFQKDLLFLNLYGYVGQLNTQRNLVCKVSTLVVIFVDTGVLKGDQNTINEIKSIVENSAKTLILLTREEGSSFTDCKEAVQELKEALKDSHAQVSVLYNRKDGSRDTVHQIRGNLTKKINHIMEPVVLDESLKERFQSLECNTDEN